MSDAKIRPPLYTPRISLLLDPLSKSQRGSIFSEGCWHTALKEEMKLTKITKQNVPKGSVFRRHTNEVTLNYKKNTCRKKEDVLVFCSI